MEKDHENKVDLVVPNADIIEQMKNVLGEEDAAKFLKFA
jgi:hypothetical protein